MPFPSRYILRDLASNQRNWRRFLATCAVLIVVLSLVVAAAILLNGGPPLADSRRKPRGIFLDEWLDGSLSPRGFNGTWITDSEILYRDEIGNLLIRDLTSKTLDVILDVATCSALLSAFDYQLSADRKYMLLANNYQKLYRHTYLAVYTIVNLDTLVETPLPNGNESIVSLQLATWSPRGNALVYVHQNNIFYRANAEAALPDHRITSNGLFGTIYNGVPDWVYEEEVFGANKALWFSPNGTRLAFARFDDSYTPTVTIPFYGYPGSLTFQYASAIPIRYPKSGATNPRVKLFCVDLEQLEGEGNVPNLTEITYPTELSSVERILSAVAFPAEDLVHATWMNRVQNEAFFRLCHVGSNNPRSPNCTTVFSYAEPHGWVEQFEPPVFGGGDWFALVLPQRQKDGRDWRHVVAVSTKSTTARPLLASLTSGRFVVTEILSWDRDNSYLYYLATAENETAVQHLYRLSVVPSLLFTSSNSSGTSADVDERPTCLTCNVRRKSTKSDRRTTRCLYNSAKFSTNHARYALTCAGPGVPEISIYETRVARNATRLEVWEDNERVSRIIGETTSRAAVTRRYRVPVPGGFEARVRLHLPPEIEDPTRPGGRKEYPMLVHVYGGPDSYQDTEKFNVDWGTYLVTNKSIIYATIDGRGSGLEDNGMLFAGYRNLGTVEIVDQINVTRYLQDTLSFIDRKKTAIFGWSYGGYATGMSLAMDDQGVFRCGMSIAPVTDWALYDSIYTERFMGLPTVADNLQGYTQGQLLNKVDKNFKTKMYYLIHGTLDDNVHYQQSLMLAKVLEQKDILFRQQTYTDEDHGIGQSRAHLYHSLENFLFECFDKR